MTGIIWKNIVLKLLKLFVYFKGLHIKELVTT